MGNIASVICSMQRTYGRTSVLRVLTRLSFALVIVAAGSIGLAVGGNDGAAAQTGKAPLHVPIVYITQLRKEPPPLSLVEPIITDKGVAGAGKAIDDNRTTGRLLKQEYELIEVMVPADGDLAAAFKEQLAAGRRLFVADLHAGQLLSLAALAAAEAGLILNVRAEDDRLRVSDCRANVMHVVPSRAMKADALAQYFAWKKWRSWFLIHGKGAGDGAYVEALRRAAKRFGLKIVEERVFEGEAGARRSDSGHVQIQKQMPVATQGANAYDVLVVADESDIFGEYLPYRTWDPRPVAGTQGLIATAWHRSHEQWAGMQMQRRFHKFAGRIMIERDYTAWVAVRSFGEAVTRIGTADAEAVKAFLLSDQFKLGAFKGQGLTFRKWNQQLRQPILLAAPRALVSVSPQPGFLHQRSPLDTLGYDEPESECRLN
jgi:ABC transporter substrate binding protein (PQQ-dependent alcohol dehydrogenase system)